MKFKVGDKVIAKKNAPYCITTNGWKGVVIKAYENGNIRIKGRGICEKSVDFLVKSSHFDLDTECNQKIVITSDGKTTLARLYQNNSVVKTAEAKCSPEDEFDFNLGATIALSRLTGFEKKVESLDWDAFKAGKIAVKVTKDNFKDFVAEAKKHKLTFKPDENFNPFDDINHLFVCVILDFKENELYIIYKNDALRCSYYLEGEEFVWA